MDLGLDSLEAFAVFAETLNFTRAAERLFISQPALHVKIKKLGQQLGVPLYTKHGKQLKLTRYGKEVARFARETKTSVDSFVSDLTGAHSETSVTLAAGRGSFLYFLGPAISKFKKKSKSALKLLTADSHRTIELVENGEAQIGVTVLQTKPPGIRAKMIADVPAMLVVPAKHKFAGLSSIGVKNLEGQQLIVPSAGKPHRVMISRLLEMKNVPWSIAVEADGWELAIEFARLEMGVAIVNGCCKLPRNLVGVPIRDFPGTKYFVITKRSIKLTDNVQSFIELIKDVG